MRIVDSAVFVGPNRHAPRPVITLVIDAGPLDGWTVSRLDPAALETLRRLLPGLTPDAVAGERQLPEFLVGLAVALQAAAGSDVGFARIGQLERRRRYLASLGYDTALIALQAGKLATSLIRWAVSAGIARPDAAHRLRVDPAAAIEKFLRQAGNWSLDQTTAALVAEAERRGIPWFRPIETDRLVQFGHGAKQARALETVTSHSAALAVTIARSKTRTNRTLAGVFLPTTRQLVVGSEQDAVRAAEQIGYPVVVKPDDRGKGRGVTVGLRNSAAVVQAFRKARQASATVLVEALVPGEDHRLLVVNGTLVAAAKRVPGRVIGDGKRSVVELVEEVNRDPRRGRGFAKFLVRLALDDEADRMLAEAGLTRASVPAAGQAVPLRGNANISTGGTAIDVTGEMHIDNRLVAERAARIIGLDVAGIDFITPDISHSWREVGGAICEVNQSPALRPHWASEGSPDVTARVMDTIVPPGSDARIPIVAITGADGRSATLLLGHILGLDGRVVGTATRDGVSIGGNRVAQGDFAGVEGCRILLRDPTVDAAVIDSAPRDLIRRGLFFDHCDTAAVLDVRADRVGTDGIATIDELAEVERLVVASARRMAVLNADDPLCVAMAAGLEAERLCFVSLDAASPLVAAHVAAGKPAVWRDGPEADAILIVHDGRAARVLMPVSAIPIALKGAARHDVRNAMVAAALAFGLGTALDDIRRGLSSFVSDPP